MVSQPLGRFTRGKLQILDASPESSSAGGMSVARAQHWVLKSVYTLSNWAILNGSLLAAMVI